MPKMRCWWTEKYPAQWRTSREPGEKGACMDDTALISLHHCICGMSVDLHGCPEFRQGSARLRGGMDVYS